MTLWISFTGEAGAGFGRLEGDTIAVHTGDLFGESAATGQAAARASVRADLPCRPSKLIALWNNFHGMAEKQGLAQPEAPLFFIKTPNTFRADGDAITIPEAAGRVVFEGELGIVIGRPARDVSEDDAPKHIFGYTIVNDVTSPGILKADDSFAQWTRAKSLDGFCPFGPTIATTVDLATANVVVTVNGRERQRYPLADMMMAPARLVSLISQGMTLEPGDIIACGTSVGAGPIPRGSTVSVTIDGIGSLTNRFE